MLNFNDAPPREFPMNPQSHKPFPTAAELVKRYHLSPSDLVIEVGSGDGAFLRSVAEYGPRTLGFESDSRLTARAIRAGVDTCSSPFTPALAEFVRSRYGTARVMVLPTHQAEHYEAAGLCLACDGVLLVRSHASLVARAA